KYESPGQARSASPWVRSPKYNEGLKGRNTARRISPFQGSSAILFCLPGATCSASLRTCPWLLYFAPSALPWLSYSAPLALPWFSYFAPLALPRLSYFAPLALPWLSYFASLALPWLSYFASLALALAFILCVEGAVWSTCPKFPAPPYC